MNALEFKNLLDLDRNMDTLIKASRIPDAAENRSLLVAAVDNSTFHIYMMNGLIHVGHRTYQGSSTVKCDISFPLRDLVPPEGFQVYPDSTEASFAKLLLDLGAKLDFFPINQDAGANRYRFYSPYHLPVAGIPNDSVESEVTAPNSPTETSEPVSKPTLTDLPIWDQLAALILVFHIDRLDALLGEEITKPSEITHEIAGKIQALAEITDIIHELQGNAQNAGSWLKSNPQIEAEITNGDPRKAVGMTLAFAANQVFSSEDIASAIDTAQDAYVAWNVALEDFLKDQTPENMAKFEEAKKVFKAMNHEAERRAGVASDSDL